MREILRDALAAQRVHHCWVFAGPHGVGKFTTARAFAQLLLDPEAAPNLMGVLESPPESTVARLVAAGTHPDLHEIRKELALHSANATIRTRKLSNIPVDVLREHMIGGKLGDDRVVDGPAYRTAQLGTARSSSSTKRSCSTTSVRTRCSRRSRNRRRRRTSSS